MEEKGKADLEVKNSDDKIDEILENVGSISDKLNGMNELFLKKSRVQVLKRKSQINFTRRFRNIGMIYIFSL